jgi:choline monooxygenase
MDNIKNLLRQFDPALTAAEAHTAPASWYTDQDFYRFETEEVLKKAWQFVAPLHWFQKPGDFHAGQFLNEPYFIIRDQNNELKAFYNVCRHHAACLFEGQGNAEKITCPYHGWTYQLDGALQKAPSLGPVKNFKKETMGLVPIPLKVWGPFVLLNFSKTPQELPADLEILLGKMKSTGFEKLKFICRRSYEFNCNWKVYVDNYLDGGYHIDILHKGLAGQLDMDAYKVENFTSWTLQSCQPSQDPTAKNGDFKDRIGEGALYAWLYPNFVINRYGPIMDTNWIVPLGINRCVTIFDYYYDESCKPDFIEKSLVASDRVQEEDIQICESVQRGLSSSAYQAGRYSASLETGMHLFHQWLHRDYSSKL